MSKQQRDFTVGNLSTRKGPRGLLVVLLLLACCEMGCRTVKPSNSILGRLQEEVTPAPPYRLSPPNERGVTKAVMVQSLTEHLKKQYRVIDERFVQSKFGFADNAEIGAKANLYIEQKLGGMIQADGWIPGQNGSFLLWKLDVTPLRYIALGVDDEFLLGPKPGERTLVGYFLLEQSPKP